jgi:hypothetical protein
MLLLTPWVLGWIIKDKIGLGLAYSGLSRIKKIDLNKLYLYMLSYKKREMGCYNRKGIDFLEDINLRREKMRRSRSRGLTLWRPGEDEIEAPVSKDHAIKDKNHVSSLKMKM